MMWRSLHGMLVALFVVGSSAWAQSRDRHANDRHIKTEQSAKTSGQSARKSCLEYGPGFVRVEGSSSCVRIGGSIGVDVGTRR